MKLFTNNQNKYPNLSLQIIDAFGSHIDTDLQQRGVEFSALFRHYDGMRAALLEPMPAFEKDTSSASQSSQSIGMQDHAATNGVTSNDDMNLLGNFGSPTKNDVGSSLLDIIGAPSSSQPAKSDLTKTDNLLDLLEGLDFGSGPSIVTNNNNTMGLNNLLSSPPPTLPSATQSSHNILDGLMSMNSGPSMTSSSMSTSNNLDDIFGDLGGSLSAAPSAPPPASSLMVYDKDELRITFDFEKSGVPNQVQFIILKLELFGLIK